MKKPIAIALMIGTLLSGLAIGGIQAVHADNTVMTQQATMKQNHAKLLSQTMDVARQGKLVTSGEFGIGSAVKDIAAKWGKPDKSSDEFAWNYSKRDISFYYDSGMGSKVTSLGSEGKLYHGVTYEEVKKAFGKPIAEHYAKKEQVATLVYSVEKKYDLLIQFRTDKNGKRLKIVSIELSKQ